MKQRLFVTLSLAGLAMATFGATKPKAVIKSLNKTTIQQPTYTEWHDLQVNAINRFPLHTNFFSSILLSDRVTSCSTSRCSSLEYN